MPKKDQPLTFTDIVLRAEADVIKQAYEARLKIDELLAERAKAYEQIAQLEEQVDTVLGEPGTFPFPPPPMPVAGFAAKAAPSTRAKPPRKPAPKTGGTGPTESAPQKAPAPSSPIGESKPAPSEEPKSEDRSSGDSDASR